MSCNSQTTTALPKTIRASSGSAAALGLKKLKTCAKTNTIYLMNTGGCEFNCSFCAQAKHSTSQQKMLSRVSWSEYKWEDTLNALAKNSKNYKRVCMQVVNTKDIFERLPDIVRKIRAKNPKTKIAMTVRTLRMTHVDGLFDAGVDEIGLNIDAIDPEQFSKIRGGNFEHYKKFVLESADRYPGKIATHLIVGMGESERQVVELMKELHDHQVIIALFAFTPVRGAKMEFRKPPDIFGYRRIQVALHLIRNNLSKAFEFDAQGRITDFGMSTEKLENTLQNSNVFETSGCSDCNRPYYTERARDRDLYNYPYRLSESEFKRVFGTVFEYR